MGLGNIETRFTFAVESGTLRAASRTSFTVGVIGGRTI